VKEELSGFASLEQSPHLVREIVALFLAGVEKEIDWKADAAGQRAK
jgi:hypothetical protein